MAWAVEFCGEFEQEFDAYSDEVQDAIAVVIEVLSRQGPQLGRPHADTLNGSKHKNMKELRCKADDGVWRVAFAFDTERKAILLCAGDKSGTSMKRFYKGLIAKADERFDRHLEQIWR